MDEEERPTNVASEGGGVCGAASGGSRGWRGLLEPTMSVSEEKRSDSECKRRRRGRRLFLWYHVRGKGESRKIVLLLMSNYTYIVVRVSI